MNTLYHWIGLLVFWGGVLYALAFGSLIIWEAKWFASTKRRYNNATLAFQTLFGYRLPMSRNTCFFACRYMGSPKRWRADWWERNLAAVHIRHARKIGYTDPE